MSTFTFATDFTYNDVTKTLAVDNIDGVMKRLSSTTVNLQTLTGQTLYTVPSAKIAIITNIICRGFTANLDQQFTVGVNSPTFNDFINWSIYNSTYLASTIGKTLNLSLNTSSSFFLSTSETTEIFGAQPHPEAVAADVLKLLMAGANTDPGTMVVDVFGYLVSA